MGALRSRWGRSPGRERTGAEIRTRTVEHADVDALMNMWGQNALEHLAILSYDRWGPGVAVPVRPEPDMPHYAHDPKLGVEVLIRAAIDDDRCVNVLAEIVEGEAIGFAMATIVAEPPNDFRSGRIDELFVRSEWRRAGVGTRLVELLEDTFAAQDLNCFRVSVNPDWEDGVAFWRSRRHWENDGLRFSRHE
jgi:GNAT superfamily N-acetyltransferase